MHAEHVYSQMQGQLDSRLLDEGCRASRGENLEERRVDDTDEDAEVEGEGDDGVDEENNLQLLLFPSTSAFSQTSCAPAGTGTEQLSEPSKKRKERCTWTLVARLPTGLMKAS